MSYNGIWCVNTETSHDYVTHAVPVEERLRSSVRPVVEVRCCFRVIAVVEDATD